MTAAATTPSIAAVCPFCGHHFANPRTGQCLSCGKRVLSPELAIAYAHPVLDREAAALRSNGSPAPTESSPLPPAPSAPEPTPLRAPVLEPARTIPTVHEPEAPRVVFKLPEGAPAAKWLTETRAIRDRVLAQIEAADARIKELEAEVRSVREETRGLRDTAGVLMALLEQLDDGAPVSEPDERPPAGPRLTRRWSLKHDRCIDCGRDSVKHVANGRCMSCDGKWRHPAKGAQS